MRTLYLIVAIAIVLALVITLFTPLLFAQSQPITVAKDEVVDTFPDGMQFKMEARSERPIKSVELRMNIRGSRGLVVAQPTFEKGATSIVTDYTHRRIGTGRYYPPGQDVTYSYRITDDAGNVLDTPSQSHIYLDPRVKWESVTDGFITVYYHGGQRTRAEMILSVTRQTMGTVGGVLETQLTQPIRLIVYNSYADMGPALPFVSSTYETTLLTEGQAYFEQGVLLLFGGDPNIRGVTSHEATHLLVHQAASSPLAQIPPWLDEGLAEFGNIQPGSEYDRTLERRRLSNTMIPLRDLAAKPGNPDDVILMYGEARNVVKFMISTYGGPKMAALLRALDDGLKIPDAIQKVYGMSLDELDNTWRKSINARPVLIATPTVVPTAVAVPTMALFSGPPVAPPAPSPTRAAPSSQAASTPAPTPGQTAQSASGGLGCNPRAGDAGVDPAAIAIFAIPGMLLALRRR